ncbi:MAG: multicopper oxidase domain-containing protein [Chloroflexota bacterium]
MVMVAERPAVAGGPDSPPSPANWQFAANGAVRAAFGIVWAIDAFMKWQPGFAAHYVGYLQNASQGQPGWLAPWFQSWLALVTPHAGVFVLTTRLVETAIALGLLFGLVRKAVYVLGAVFSLLIWSTAGGFGGPYTSGATNVGPSLIYVLVFFGLIVFTRQDGPTPYSVDYYLERRWPAWQRVAEWAPARSAVAPLPRLSWPAQSAAIAAILVTIGVLSATLQSTLNVAPATPANAAAAVSPLNLVTGPVTQARDAALPPLLGPGNSVDVTLKATDTTVSIAGGVSYQAWTFGGTVPGPILHVRQGQTVNVTFVNDGHMAHSIDFHAADVPPNIAYRDVLVGQSLQFSFVAQTPGAFIYHCGTAPVLAHMANGMYGAIVVDPAQPLPPAAASYVLVQGEWYTQQAQGTLMAPNMAKMNAVTPDEVVFNGVANQYKDHPLPVKAGQRVRLYVVDAGPSLPSAFHVVGAIFQAVYPDGDPAHVLTGVSTYSVAPGEGVVLDLTIPEPGRYIFVDHAMRNMMLGAAGVLNVTP